MFISKLRKSLKDDRTVEILSERGRGVEAGGSGSPGKP